MSPKAWPYSFDADGRTNYVINPQAQRHLELRRRQPCRRRPLREHDPYVVPLRQRQSAIRMANLDFDSTTLSSFSTRSTGLATAPA